MSDKTYVTKEDLYIGADRAYAKGRKVSIPEDQIERYGWREYLVGENTKTAARAQEEASVVNGPAVVYNTPGLETPDNEQQNTAPTVTNEEAALAPRSKKRSE